MVANIFPVLVLGHWHLYTWEILGDQWEDVVEELLPSAISLTFILLNILEEEKVHSFVLQGFENKDWLLTAFPLCCQVGEMYWFSGWKNKAMMDLK